MMPDQHNPSTNSFRPPRSILFICTGNTCRSPLAEALCKNMLANRLGCAVEDLHQHGYQVLSAGIAASPGDAASPESLVVAREFGSHLDAHRSRLVNPELLQSATDIFVMTQSHQTLLEMRFPDMGPIPRLLCGDAGDLSDPMGEDQARYRACAARIQQQLIRILSEWLPA